MTQRDPEQLREEIQGTREELGATVEALADKADVKAHAREKVGEIKAEAQSRAPLIAGAGILLALIMLWRIKRD
jgi:hypothetical protein